MTLKDDEQGDPLITDRLCQMKGILQPGQYDEALDILTKVGAVLREALAEMNLTLIDFKIEIGYDNDGKCTSWMKSPPTFGASKMKQAIFPTKLTVRN